MGVTEHPRFASFSLAEVHLLALGLWVLGEENRVDHKLMPDYRTLRTQAQVALGKRVAEYDGP